MIGNNDNRTDNVTGTELMYQIYNFSICTKSKLSVSDWLKNYKSLLKPLFES